MFIWEQAAVMDVSNAGLLSVFLLISILERGCFSFKLCENIKNEQYFDGLLCMR